MLIQVEKVNVWFQQPQNPVQPPTSPEDGQESGSNMPGEVTNSIIKQKDNIQFRDLVQIWNSVSLCGSYKALAYRIKMKILTLKDTSISNIL